MTVLLTKNRQIHPQYMKFWYGQYEYLELYRIPIDYLLKELNRGIFNDDKYVKNRKIKHYILTRYELEQEMEKEPVKKIDIGFISLA